MAKQQMIAMVALAAGLVGSGAVVGWSASTSTESKTKVSSADRKFVLSAARGGMAEVELGQLATKNASSDAVKQFGQRMVDDHGKANDELKQLAASKGITLPTSLDRKHQHTINHLNKLSGSGFDHAYASDMVKDHSTDVREFEREASRGKDPDIKAWAEKTVPTLREHLNMARALPGVHTP